jgi:2-polyprenyl-3-methyl-5-hydroxy-6-metoxy-1,4-benzoquinol methylase
MVVPPEIFKMNYPLIINHFAQETPLFLPDPDQVRPVYEALFAQNPATPFPYWAKLWPSAVALTSFLLAEPSWVKGKKILEIGAGIGLPSFCMARLASEITITDHDPEAIELAQKNIAHLGLTNAKATHLDWNQFPENLICDTVLMSDVNYSPDQFENLLALITSFMKKGCDMIIATPQRITATMFVPAIQPYIRRTMQRTIDDNGQAVNISLLVLSSS